MEARELRIGNWYNEFGMPKQATSDFIFRLDDIQGAGKTAIDVSPIHLTPEWLERAGFEKDDSGVEKSDLDYCEWLQKDYPVIGVLCQSSDKNYLFDENTDTLRIAHVHQLQNLYFALTGTELEIK